jgi:hypothetical protein
LKRTRLFQAIRIQIQIDERRVKVQSRSKLSSNRGDGRVVPNVKRGLGADSVRKRQLHQVSAGKTATAADFPGVRPPPSHKRDKIDLEEKRMIENIQASEWAIEKGALYAETSAMTGARVEKMFQLRLGTFVKQKGANNQARQKSGVKLVDAQDVVRPGKTGCC